MFPVVPPMLVSLSKSNVEKEYDMSSLRQLIVGAAPVAPEVLKTVAKMLNCVIVQGDTLFYIKILVKRCFVTTASLIFF